MRTFLQFIGGSLMLVAAGCPTSVPALCDNGACASDAGGNGDVMGTDGGGDVVQPPAGCDPAVEPKDAPKCVDSDFGVFVDANGGADGNSGRRDAPVKSITAALGKLGNKNRVYVCEGTYVEHVKLTSAVSLYGGFACGAAAHELRDEEVARTPLCGRATRALPPTAPSRSSPRFRARLEGLGAALGGAWGELRALRRSPRAPDPARVPAPPTEGRSMRGSACARRRRRR